MKAVLDACVLFPTVMRQMLLGVAAAGLYRPLWSARIAEEWARAAARGGPEAEALARAEIAAEARRFPRAVVPADPALERRLWLPDAGDVHVLAAAVAAGADAIVTVNARDFPRGLLADEGLARADPDAFLLGFLEATPEPVVQVAHEVLAEARRLSGEPLELRALMRRARLPRLGKRLELLSA